MFAKILRWAGLALGIGFGLAGCLFVAGYAFTDWSLGVAVGATALWVLPGRPQRLRPSSSGPCRTGPPAGPGFANPGVLLWMLLTGALFLQSATWEQVSPAAGHGARRARTG